MPPKNWVSPIKAQILHIHRGFSDRFHFDRITIHGVVHKCMEGYHCCASPLKTTVLKILRQKWPWYRQPYEKKPITYVWILCAVNEIILPWLFCLRLQQYLLLTTQISNCTSSGWPSGLRRQTQDFPCLRMKEHSGPQMWAWVQIPLLTLFKPFNSFFDQY